MAAEPQGILTLGVSNAIVLMTLQPECCTAGGAAIS